MTENAQTGVVYITQRDLQARWNISGRTLERWRSEKYGPAWVCIGGSIRYRMVDGLGYEEQSRHPKIAQRGTGAGDGGVE